MSIIALSDASGSPPLIDAVTRTSGKKDDAALTGVANHKRLWGEVGDNYGAQKVRQLQDLNLRGKPQEISSLSP